MTYSLFPTACPICKRRIADEEDAIFSPSLREWIHLTPCKPPEPTYGTIAQTFTPIPE